MRRLRETVKDIATVPNAITLGRLILAHKIAADLKQDPKGQWKKVGLFLATDMLDGAAARLGNKFRELQKYGFRTSEFGKKADPICDKVSVPLMFNAGTASGVLPEFLGFYLKGQKALMASRAVDSAIHGHTIEATERHNEFRTLIGYAGPFIAESFTHPVAKNLLRYGGLAMGIHGTGEAIGIGDPAYRRQAREQAEQEGRSHTQNGLIHVGSLVLTGVGVGMAHAASVEISRQFEYAQ